MPEAEVVTAEATRQEIPAHCQRFRAGRKASGVSLRALVEALGCSEQAILQFEVGKQQLALERFAAACELLGLNAHGVLFGRGPLVEGPPQLPSKGRPARRKVSE